MSKTNKIRVRLRDQNHPTGSRRRAGLVFGTQPDVYSVTEEQLTAIKADTYLQILPSAKAKVEEEGGESQNEIKLDRATKPQLIAILTEELKLVEGEDFNPEASNAILKQLVIDTRTKKSSDIADEGDEDDDDEGEDDDTPGEDE